MCLQEIELQDKLKVYESSLIQSSHRLEDVLVRESEPVELQEVLTQANKELRSRVEWYQKKVLSENFCSSCTC